jgi:hypothetical protein
MALINQVVEHWWWLGASPDVPGRSAQERGMSVAVYDCSSSRWNGGLETSRPGSPS